MWAASITRGGNRPWLWTTTPWGEKAVDARQRAAPFSPLTPCKRHRRHIQQDRQRTTYHAVETSRFRLFRRHAITDLIHKELRPKLRFRLFRRHAQVQCL